MNRTWLDPVLRTITSHWLSLIGAGIVTTAAISWLLALPAQARGHVSNPYAGLLLFVVLPVVFVVGLIAIAIGATLSRRRIRLGLAAAADRAVTMKRIGMFVAVMTVVNVLIGTQLTYRAVEHMETVQFCGQTCHAMDAEFRASAFAPHSKVACVECHVAPGASGWVAAKVSGTRQLLAVMRDNWERPIPSPIESGRLVSTEASCEGCHRTPSRPIQLITIPSYAPDEANTRSYTVLAMKTARIHEAHKGVSYLSDAKRSAIPAVTAKSGEFRLGGDLPGGLTRHEMDCTDCHNRPAHTFEAAERAVHGALESGEISAKLPFVRKKGIDLLMAEYPSQDQAERQITQQLRDFYQQQPGATQPGRDAEVAQASRTLVSIYKRNVFPDLKVTWGTYATQLGHTSSPGCFRCHDDEHKMAGGKAISQDCASCHEMVANDEPAPEILKTLGLASLGETKK